MSEPSLNHHPAEGASVRRTVLLVAVLVVATAGLFGSGGGCRAEDAGSRDTGYTVTDGGVGLCDVGANNWKVEQLDPAVSSDDAGTPSNLFAVWGSDATSIWAVGAGGTVLFYDGTSWTRQATPTDQQLTAVWGVPGGEVWAAGFGATVISFDGQRWTDRSPADEFFVAGDAGVPTGDAAAGLRRNLWGAWVTGSEEQTDAVYVVGDRGTILAYLEDAWIRVPSGVQEDLSAVWGSGPNRVFAVGDFGTVIVGSASGFSPPQNTNVSQGLRAVWGRSGSHVFAVGVSGTVLFHDGGRWCELEGAPQQVLRGVWGPANDRSTTYFVGWDGTLLTLDGRPSCGGSPPVFTIFSCITSNRLEGIWGTLVDGPLPDAGADIGGGDAGIVDAAIPQIPAVWAAGVSGTVVTGP